LDSILEVGRIAGVALAGEAKFMKATLFAVLFLVAVCGLNAQEPNAIAARSNAANAFDETSAAQVKLLEVNAPGSDAANTNPEAASDPAATPATPAPAPATPKYIFGERDDYRFQLGVGFEYVRFQSSQFNENLLGLNTTLTYFTNSWFGVEGDVVTGFSTGTINGFHAKLVGGLGGIHLGARRAHWEPWVHALVGGSHLQPQTAAGGRTALMALAGGGADLRKNARLSFRFEGDWMYTGYFSQSQDSFQAVAGIVLHF
jgi:opacity protein-like surface antigen